MREAGLVTKRIQGAKGYAQLRKEDRGTFPARHDRLISRREGPYFPRPDSKVPV